VPNRAWLIFDVGQRTMKRDMRYVLIAGLAIAAFPVFAASVLVLTNVDYDPLFYSVKTGMQREEVLAKLQGIKVRLQISGSSEWLRFVEPDIWPSYTYDIYLEHGRVVRTKSDL